MPKTRQLTDDLTVLFRNLEKRVSELESRVPSRKSGELAYPLLERVRKTSTQAVGNNSTVDIIWQQSDGPHTGAFLSTSAASSFLNSQFEGLYIASATIQWAALAGSVTNAEDFWAVEIEKNDTDILAQSLPGAVGGNGFFGVASHVSCAFYLEEGDYIKFKAFQSTGASRNISTTLTSANMIYVGPFVSADDISRFESK